MRLLLLAIALVAGCSKSEPAGPSVELQYLQAAEEVRAEESRLADDKRKLLETTKNLEKYTLLSRSDSNGKVIPEDQKTIDLANQLITDMMHDIAVQEVRLEKAKARRDAIALKKPDATP